MTTTEHLDGVALTKAQTDSQKIRSAIGVLRGGRAQTSQPFNYDAATRQFASWVYKAININAKARASGEFKIGRAHV